MIAGIMRLGAMYVITRIFVEIAFPGAKQVVKYLFYAGFALTILGVVGPRLTQVLDDVHNASITYTKVKEGVETATNGVNAVTSWPEAKENIPLIGTGASKYPPGLTIMEKLRPSSIRFDLPAVGTITQEYKGADHHGIDFAVKDGTTVKVSREGKVIAINKDDIYGNYVMVDHGGGWVTLYAHLSKVTATPGKKLWGNDNVVGLSGSTGNSTGPHLHFEIRVGGKTIDPKVWMK